jgi:hypothetical protein
MCRPSLSLVVGEPAYCRASCLERSIDIAQTPSLINELSPALAALARGSWLVARGSWLVARGSWLVARGSWLVALTQLPAQDQTHRRPNQAWPMASSSWVVDGHQQPNKANAPMATLPGIRRSQDKCMATITSDLRQVRGSFVRYLTTDVTAAWRLYGSKAAAAHHPRPPSPTNSSTFN